MIAVEKPAGRVPADWVPVSEKERSAVLAAFRGKKRTEKVTFPFKAYGHPSLRRALNEIFGYKCAYCESVFDATQPVAVEHYRPKGEVVEGRKRLRGYYWLAADWSNLLPSCTDCNSPRTQTDSNGRTQVRGKGNQFPVANPRRRASGPKSSLEAEGALLLNPSLGDPRLDPERHLEFLAEDGRFGLVRPALVEGAESRHGRASIDVYALDRNGLVARRRDVAKHVLFVCKQTERALERHQKHPRDAGYREEYEECVAALKEILAHGQPYLAMIRQIIARRYPGIRFS